MVDEIMPRDENYEPVIAGVSSVDGESIVLIHVNPDTDGTGTHGVVVSIE